jgi:hypothetical protein
VKSCCAIVKPVSTETVGLGCRPPNVASTKSPAFAANPVGVWNGLAPVPDVTLDGDPLDGIPAHAIAAIVGVAFPVTAAENTWFAPTFAA